MNWTSSSQWVNEPHKTTNALLSLFLSRGIYLELDG